MVVYRRVVEERRGQSREVSNPLEDEEELQYALLFLLLLLHQPLLRSMHQTADLHLHLDVVPKQQEELRSLALERELLTRREGRSVRRTRLDQEQMTVERRKTRRKKRTMGE